MLGQGTPAEKAGIRLGVPLLQGFWDQCQAILELPLPDLMDGSAAAEGSQQNAAPLEARAALQRKVAALSGFGRLALQQVSI